MPTCDVSHMTRTLTCGVTRSLCAAFSPSSGEEARVKYVLGVVSIAFGLFVCFAAPALTILPGLAAICGGFRVITGSGSL